MFCAILGEVPQILNHWLEIAWVNDDLLRVYIKVSCLSSLKLTKCSSFRSHWKVRFAGHGLFLLGT